MEKYAPGLHLLVDFWGASHMTDTLAIETAFRHAVSASGATILTIHLHEFGVGAGITGVAVLAESHMSIHTWPERDYMAIDIFMCGDANIDAALSSLEKSFTPARQQVKRCLRGSEFLSEQKE